MYNPHQRAIQSYQSAASQTKLPAEQVAIILDNIARIIKESEKAHAKKDFAQAAEKSAKAIELCTGLCSILLPENDAEATKMDATGTNWLEYFQNLIQTIGRICTLHNSELLEKTVSSILQMSALWRLSSKKGIDQNNPSPPYSADKRASPPADQNKNHTAKPPTSAISGYTSITNQVSFDA